MEQLQHAALGIWVLGLMGVVYPRLAWALVMFTGVALLTKAI